MNIEGQEYCKKARLTFVPLGGVDERGHNTPNRLNKNVCVCTHIAQSAVMGKGDDGWALSLLFLVLGLQVMRWGERESSVWGWGRLVLSPGVVNDSHNVDQHSNALYGRESSAKKNTCSKGILMCIFVAMLNHFDSTQLIILWCTSQSMGNGQYMWW